MTSNSTKQHVSANNLNWKPVEISDRVNFSADGFAGLEEISGVEVIKSENGLSFVERLQDDCKKRHTSANHAVKKKQRLDSKVAPTAKYNLEKRNPVDRKDENEDDHEKIDLSLLRKWSDECCITNERILRRLFSLGFFEPTKIQSMAIPAIRNGSDVVGKASTGSGKTLAFILPIIDALEKADNVELMPEKQADKQSVRALVISPTRELAKQTQKVAVSLISKDTNCVCLVGGLAIEKQQRLLKKGADILIGTPGRLWELIQTDDLDFSDLRFLVLDEADRLVEKGHFEDFEHIVNRLFHFSKKIQTLLFSATIKQDDLKKSNTKRMEKGRKERLESSISKLLAKLPMTGLSALQFLDADPNQSLAPKITESFLQCTKYEKPLFLYYFVTRFPGKTLVFVNSIDRAKEIYQLFNLLKLDILTIHGKMDQKRRYASVEKFNLNDKSILIASDVASRGLDIKEVNFIIHYDLPRDTDLYIHRSGRTARAGKHGLSLAFLSGEETIKYKKLMVKMGKFFSEIRQFKVSYDLIEKLRVRMQLAREISSVRMSHNVSKRQDNWLQEFANDVGADLDELDFGKRKAEVKNLPKLKEQLNQILKQPILIGFSAKYLTSGRYNRADDLLKGRTHDMYVGCDPLSAFELLQD